LELENGPKKSSLSQVLQSHAATGLRVLPTAAPLSWTPRVPPTDPQSSAPKTVADTSVTFQLPEGRGSTNGRFPLFQLPTPPDEQE
jgi:hypothetical protein